MPYQVIDVIETICKKRKDKTDEWKWKKKCILQGEKKHILHKLKPHSTVNYMHANESKFRVFTLLSNHDGYAIEGSKFPNFHSIIAII